MASFLYGSKTSFQCRSTVTGTNLISTSLKALACINRDNREPIDFRLHVNSASENT